MSVLHKLNVTGLDQIDGGLAKAAAFALEAGQVLVFSELAFALNPREKRLIGQGVATGDAKNISFDPQTATLKGSATFGQAHDDLAALLARFGGFAQALVGAIAPEYQAGLTRKRASFRPAEIAGRQYSWRKDDRRRHVDAFPSSPTQGSRILRVFANVDQEGAARKWRVGPDFERYAQAFLPQAARRQLPGLAGFMAATGITRARRSLYDQIMLDMHDAAKRDLNWQAATPAEEISFLPGEIWMVYTDQLPHSAHSGKNALEQTFMVAPQVLLRPEISPAAIISRLRGQNCLPR